jgi:hypothetical protein
MHDSHVAALAVLLFQIPAQAVRFNPLLTNLFLTRS